MLLEKGRFWELLTTITPDLIAKIILLSEIKVPE
jgi:hypothetical protein